MDPLDVSDSAAWFALRTKSNREAVVASALLGKGYDAWYPRYRDHRSRSSAPKAPPAPHAPLSGRAAFPGYVFCQLDASKRMPVLTIPGIVGFVSSGKTPLPIDDKEISSLRLVMESELPVGPCDYLKIDDRVRVTGTTDEVSWVSRNMISKSPTS